MLEIELDTELFREPKRFFNRDPRSHMLLLLLLLSLLPLLLLLLLLSYNYYYYYNNCIFIIIIFIVILLISFFYPDILQYLCKVYHIPEKRLVNSQIHSDAILCRTSGMECYF